VEYARKAPNSIQARPGLFFGPGAPSFASDVSRPGGTARENATGPEKTPEDGIRGERLNGNDRSVPDGLESAAAEDPASEADQSPASKAAAIVRVLPDIDRPFLPFLKEIRKQL